MGTDAHYQAMPDGCDLLEKAKAKGRDWIERLPQFYQYADGLLLNQMLEAKVKGKLFLGEEGILFAEEAIRTVKSYPGLKERCLFWGRAWDKVYYLLAAERRDETPHPNDRLIARAIFGGDILENPPPDNYDPAYYEHYHIVKFMPSNEVRQSAGILSQFTEAQLRANFDFEKMRKSGIYRLIQMSEGGRGFQEIYEAFVELREFYNLVASYDEGVITELS